MNAKLFVACDLGAESGRIIAGNLSADRIQLNEIHRFSTGPSRVKGTLRWDILKFFDEIKQGLMAVKASHQTPDGVSIDSWGVDYAYASDSEPLLSLPFHYRDSRTDVSYPAMLQKAGRDQIFAETGLQFMQINTLYQLYDDVLNRPRIQEIADHFLPIADYLHYLLSGEAVAELSVVSTTQVYNTGRKAWSEALIGELGCSPTIFPSVVSSGTLLGKLTGAVEAEIGLSGCRVYATCSHDTGAAVAGVPAEGKNWAFLSSGTWSLLGVEADNPIINEACLSANFTNELGFAGRVRFLKNIMGLWLLQETKRELAANGVILDYASLDAEAEKVPALASIVYPNQDEFLKPGRMIEKIREFCQQTAQRIPTSPGELARCILESLALSYADIIDQLTRTFGFQIDVLHIVGGGSRSRLLNQFSADATGLPVFAGPVEATALGNLLIQAYAAGEFSSIQEIRQVIRNSFPIDRFEPQRHERWAAALERYQKVKSLHR